MMIQLCFIVLYYSMLPIYFYLVYTRYLDEKRKRSELLRMLTSGTLQPSKWIAEIMIDPCSNFFPFSCMQQIGVAEGAIHSGR